MGAGVEDDVDVGVGLALELPVGVGLALELDVGVEVEAVMLNTNSHWFEVPPRPV